MSLLSCVYVRVCVCTIKDVYDALTSLVIPVPPVPHPFTSTHPTVPFLLGRKIIYYFPSFPTSNSFLPCLPVCPSLSLSFSFSCFLLLLLSYLLFTSTLLLSRPLPPRSRFTVRENRQVYPNDEIWVLILSWRFETLLPVIGFQTVWFCLGVFVCSDHDHKVLRTEEIHCNVRDGYVTKRNIISL